nr:immunoglobulin light chain junction region [Macaca mulatta]
CQQNGHWPQLTF